MRLYQANAAGTKLTSIELAELAFSLRFEDAAEMLALAELAVEQAALESDEASAFAHAHLGNALRINAEFDRACAALDRAAQLYGKPSALVLSFRASLHQDRRELEAAQSCLAAASELVTDRDLKGKLLLQSAYIINLAGHHREAADIVKKTLDLLDAPLHVAAAFQALALYLTNAGEVVNALNVLREGAPVFSVLGKLGRLRVTWMEGNLAATCGDFDTALSHLSTARQGFHSENMPQEVALISLEISVATANQGYFWKARDELQGVRAVLSALRIADEATAAALLEHALKARTVREFVSRVDDLRKLVASQPRTRLLGANARPEGHTPDV